jgi:peptide/nickel transport system substrate-binding protein
MGTEENYWSRWQQRRYSRRSILRAAGWTGAGIAGLSLLACKGTTSKSGTPSSSSGSAPSASSQTQRENQFLTRTGTPPSANDTPKRGGTVYIAQGSNPVSLDPHRTSSAFTGGFLAPVMSRLYARRLTWSPIDALDFKYDGELAASTETPDAATWTFKLQPKAKFTNDAPVNGHAVEAEDVKATMAGITDAQNPSRGSFDMVDATKIETPDKQTVTFKLNYPFAPFQELLASGIYSWILPREAGVSYDPAKKVIGSGPFSLDSYTPDVSAIYKKSPTYWDSNLPYIDTAQLSIIADANAQLAQFTANHLQVLGNVTADTIDVDRKQNPDADVIPAWQHGGEVLYFQLRDSASPFQNINLRRALSLAIDRQTIGKSLEQDKYALAFNVTLDEGKWAMRIGDLSQDSQQWYQFNLPKAKQMFQDSGQAGKPFKLLFPWPHPRGLPLRNDVEAIYSMLKELPWQLEFVLIDYTKDWVGGGKGVRYGAFPSNSIVITGIEGSSGYDGYLYNWWDSKSPSSISGLNDPKFDSMLTQARSIVNEDQRLKAYLDVQRYLADQMVAVAGNPNGVSYSMSKPALQNWLVGDTTGTQLSHVWLKS